MLKSFVKQIIRLVLLLLAVSFVVFFLVSVSPIDPVQANVGQAAYANLSEEKRAALEMYWGSNTPMLQRYVAWLGDVLQGDLGTSLRYNAPVLNVIATRALNSLLLMGIAWVVSGVLGFLLGVIAAAKRGRVADKIIKGVCYVLASTPSFWIGLLVLMVFAVWLGWFPVGFSSPIGKSAADATALDALYHVALPAFTLSIAGIANIALHTREKAVDIMEDEAFQFALVRGMTKAQALRKYGLRRMLLPALTLQFASIAEVFGGSVLVEQVFSYPGLGQATVVAGLGGDAPLLAGIALFSALFVFVGNLIANMLYPVVDPRLRKGRTHTGFAERAGQKAGEHDAA